MMTVQEIREQRPACMDRPIRARQFVVRSGRSVAW